MAAAFHALLAQPHKVIEQIARYILHQKREPVVGLSNDEGTYSSHFSFGQTSLNTFKQTMGEAGATDEDSIARARRVLPQVLAAYGTNDVYNANETALMYCHTYQQRIVKKLRQETNAKRTLQRPTATICVNATGTHSIPPQMITKGPGQE
jgi:hypothetical protein